MSERPFGAPGNLPLDRVDDAINDAVNDDIDDAGDDRDGGSASRGRRRLCWSFRKFRQFTLAQVGQG